MKVIKPLLLGFLWRTYKRQGNHLALTGLLSFPFATPEIPLTEQEMWQKIGPLFPPDTAWDEGIPKDRGEVLLLADCHASQGHPVTQRRVTVRVGPVIKILEVFGDRTWIRHRGFIDKSTPEPFTSMPIDYAHAFGGPGFGANPTGKGFADPSDGSARPLPNIEDPFHSLSSPDDRPDPAGFGPLGLTWTQRKNRIGHYRAEELGGKEPPPLPENTDWTLFNQAPPDQWLSGYLTGGEPFSLEGLHPETDVQEGRLPRILVRSFVSFKDGGMTEVPLRPETVWLFPGLSMGVVIHRGAIPIGSDDASEVESLLLAAEDPGENRPISHFSAVKSRRDTRDPEDYSRFGDAPLLPSRLADDPRANLLDVNKILEGLESDSAQKVKEIATRRLDGIQKKIDMARESLLAAPPGAAAAPRAAELEKISHQEEQVRKAREELSAPPQKPTLVALKEMQEKAPKRDEIREKAAEAVRSAVDKIPQEILDKMQKTREELVALGLRIQAPPKVPLGAGIDPGRFAASLRAALDLSASGKPSGDAPSPEPSETRERMDGPIASLSETSEKLKDPAIREKMAGIIRVVHHFAPPVPNPEWALMLRQQVTGELSKNRSFRDRNLRGADLGGLDLSGVDFSGADLIGANFSGSTLAGANFVEAWAAHGNFSGATLDRTDFSGANLGCSDFTGTRGTGLSFEKTILTGAVFTDCDLSDSRFGESEVFQVFFKRSRIRRGQFPNAKFIRAGTLPYPHPAGHSETDGPEARISVESGDFSGSDFSKALFMMIDFASCDLSGCILDQASFLECSGPGTRFDGASLKKAAFPKSGDFRQSSFRKANLTGANLRELDLEGSDFRGAILSKMDGSGGVFRHANLSGVTAIQSLFQKADLTAADARGGNFRQALFLKADLRGTDFSYGSLYKAGFTGATIDDTTLWDQALTGKSNLSRDGSA